MRFITGASVRLGGYQKPVLGPNLIPDSPTIDPGAGWTQVDASNYTKTAGGFTNLGILNIVEAETEYELSYALSGWGGGSCLVRLTDGGYGNEVSFAAGASDGTFTSRATGNALSSRLAFGAAGGNGSLQIIYFKQVRPPFVPEGSGFSSGFSDGFS